MLTEFISNFNWIDVLMLVVLVRIVYAGMNSNVLTELFSFLGSIAAVFITLHYYVRFARFLHEMVFIPDMLDEFFAIALLWITVHIVFKLIIAGWSLIFKVEAHPVFDKWGGFVFSLGRSTLFCSLLFVFLIVCGNDYIRQMAGRSWTGTVFIDLGPNVYAGICDRFLSKFYPDEIFNDDAMRLRGLTEPKDKKKFSARN